MQNTPTAELWAIVAGAHLPNFLAPPGLVGQGKLGTFSNPTEHVVRVGLEKGISITFRKSFAFPDRFSVYPIFQTVRVPFEKLLAFRE